MKKILILTLASTMALSGCYGKFAMTKKLYDFNGKIHPNGIVQSIIMVGLNIIPVYGIAILADALILNSVEFWTGSNPMTTGSTYEEKDAQGNQVTAIKLPDGSMDLTVRNAYGAEAKMTLVREADMVKALDAQGKVLAQADLQDSNIAD